MITELAFLITVSSDPDVTIRHHTSLARIFHDSAAPTEDMTVLPVVLGPRALQRTVQVRLGSEFLRLPGGTLIFSVSRHRIMKYPG